MRQMLFGLVLAVLALSAILVLPGCNEEKEQAAAGTPKVTATIPYIADIAKAVGGDKVEVTTVIAPGNDAHSYQPTRADIQLLSQADVIFYNGLMFEGKMGDLLTQMGRKGKKVWAVSENYEESDLLFPEGEDHADPHIFMDVALWIKATDLVTEALIDYDPANKDYYTANAEAYKKQLVAVQSYVSEVITTIPKDKRVLITAHDAFGYMGRSFDMEVKGVQGISTEDEASLKEVRDLADYIVAKKIDTVFIERDVNEKNVEALIELCKSKGHDVNIGGVLFSCAGGPVGKYEGTYIGMMDHNATVLANSLGGEAPEKGFQDKLSGLK